MVDATRYIRQLLSAQKPTIDRLASEDTDFREICDEFDVSVDAHNYRSQSQDPGAEVKASEYRALVEELYIEITRILEANQG